MNKLYAGLAAAALTATGIACSAGAANASGAWPSTLGFTPSTWAVSTALSTDGNTMYTASIDSTDSSSVVDVATTNLVTGAPSDPVQLTFAADPTFEPQTVAVAPTGTILVGGNDDGGSAYAIGHANSANATTYSSTTSAGAVAVSPDGLHGVVGGDGAVLPVDLSNGTAGAAQDLNGANTDGSSSYPTALVVGNDGAFEAAVETVDADFNVVSDKLVTFASDSAPAEVPLDGFTNALVAVGGGFAAAVQTPDNTFEIQYVGGDQTQTPVTLSDMPSQLVASPDGTTVWAIQPSSYGVTAVKDGVATTLDGSSATTAASYGDVFAAAGSNDNLYLVAAPWDAAADADGPTAVYALGTPSATATNVQPSFEGDGSTLDVLFNGVESDTPLTFVVTVTDPTGHSQTMTAWQSGHGDGTALAMFPDLDATLAYDISIRSFNGGFLGAPVAASYLPSLGSESAAIHGTATVGQVVSATVSGAWPTGTTLSYEWGVVVVNGESGGLVDIAGATGSSLTLTPDLVGKRIAVVVTGHKDGYTDSAAYSDVFGPIASATQPSPPTVQVPTTVGTIKAVSTKAGSNKLTLLLGGVTDAPGKVKVYDGKLLIGKAKISNGAVTVKLKKHLTKGKHTIKLKYAGSPELASFTKSLKLKVS